MGTRTWRWTTFSRARSGRPEEGRGVAGGGPAPARRSPPPRGGRSSSVRPETLEALASGPPFPPRAHRPPPPRARRPPASRPLWPRRPRPPPHPLGSPPRSAPARPHQPRYPSTQQHWTLCDPSVAGSQGWRAHQGQGGCKRTPAASACRQRKGPCSPPPPQRPPICLAASPLTVPLRPRGGGHGQAGRHLAPQALAWAGVRRRGRGFANGAGPAARRPGTRLRPTGHAAGFHPRGVGSAAGGGTRVGIRAHATLGRRHRL